VGGISPHQYQIIRLSDYHYQEFTQEFTQEYKNKNSLYFNFIHYPIILVFYHCFL